MPDPLRSPGPRRALVVVLVLAIALAVRLLTSAGGGDVVGPPPARVDDVPQVAPRDGAVRAADLSRRPVAPVPGPPVVDAPAAARVHGVLTWRASSAPAAGIALHAFGPLGSATATSGPDGSYELELDAGSWSLGAVPPGGMPFCDELELVPGAAQRHDRAIDAGDPLCVKVWSRRSGGAVPLAAARIAAVDGRTDSLAHADWCAALGVVDVLTDQDGRAQIACGSRRPNLLFVSAHDHLAQVVALDLSPFLSSSPFAPDGCVHVVLEPAGAVLRGRIVDPDAAPVAGAIVFVSAPPLDRRAGVARVVDGLGAPFVTTDARGEFALTLPSPGLQRTAFEVVALPRRDGLVSRAVRPLTLDEIAAPPFVELRLPRGFRQVIEFVDAEGRPVDGLASVRDPRHGALVPIDRVRPRDLSGAGAGRVLAVRDGRITFVHPGGPVAVGLSPGGRWDPREYSVRLPFAADAEPLRIVVTAR